MENAQQPVRNKNGKTQKLPKSRISFWVTPIVFLIFFIGLFTLFAIPMGLSNMLSTVMNTAFALLTDTCLYIMAIAVIMGAVSALLTEFGVVAMLNHLLSPLMKPIYGLPGAAALGIVTTYLSDNPAILSLAEDHGFRKYFKKYQLYGLTNLGTAFGMGLIVSTFMLGLGNIQGGSVVSAILIGNLGAIIGSVVSTRLMLMQTKKIFGTEEYVEDYLEYETYYEKVRGKLESEADDTVTDKEANQSTFTYALFSTKSDSSSSASGDSEMSAKDKAKLKAKAEKVAAAADFDKEAKAEKADTSTYSYTTAEDPADDEAMDEKVIAAAQKLQNGEVSDVIEVKDRGYYVIRMDKTHDESATKDKKKSLASQKREAAFNKQMNTWKKKIRFTLDKKLWKQIKFTDLFTTASGNATR